MPSNTEIETEIASLNHERQLVENITNNLDELWLLLMDRLDYLSWLQGILNLCHTGK